MRRIIPDAGDYGKEEEPVKRQRGDKKKQAEFQMRTYQFQQELLETEKFKEYSYIDSKKGAKMLSEKKDKG